MLTNATVQRPDELRKDARSSPQRGDRVAVLMTFHLTPDHDRVWQQTWKELAEIAAAEMGCRDFRLMTDSRDPSRRFMVGEWESHSALAAFWRSGAAHWLEDALGYAHSPTEVTICEPVLFDELGG